MAKGSPIREIYDKLVQKALEDGTISKDEQAILDKVELELEAYEDLLKNAMNDRIISEDESKVLRRTRAQMLDKVWLVADEDQQINEEEANLLNLLLKLLRNMT